MNNLGHAVNADVVVENFDVIYHAVSQIGTGVSVKTCEVHVQSLYDYMEIPIRSDLVACETLRVLMGLLTACLGEVVKVQGWQLRRCLSHVNRICGRPYGPKGEKLRTICAQMGVTWPEGMEEEENDGVEEEAESEEETEDEEAEDEEAEDEELEDEEGLGTTVPLFRFFSR